MLRRLASSFVLVHPVDGLAVRARLRDRGHAVRRGDTFLAWARIGCASPFVIT
jgi:hypothetical protein